MAACVELKSPSVPLFQRENFLIKNSLLGALRASAVQSLSPYAEIALPELTIRKPEDPNFLNELLRHRTSLV